MSDAVVLARAPAWRLPCHSGDVIGHDGIQNLNVRRAGTAKSKARTICRNPAFPAAWPVTRLFRRQPVADVQAQGEAEEEHGRV